MIRTFLEICDGPIEECEPDKALTSSYLGPSLCVKGPQLFQMKLAGGYK